MTDEIFNAGVRFGRAIVIAALAAALIGCVPKKPVRDPYFGPTKPLMTVVAEVNANNAKVDQLWTRGSFKIAMRDADGKRHAFDGDANLVYRRPGDFLLRGKVFGKDAFEVGCNETQYWMGVKATEPSTLWRGSFEKLATVDPERLPVRPDLVMQVLAVGEIPSNLRQSPAPVMRFNNDEDAYMLVWSTPLQDRWAATKEVWYDRETLRPRVVILFDENGRILLRAYLQNARRVESETAESERPWVASDYDLFFPPSKTKMTLHFSAIRFENLGAPSDASFRTPKADAFGELIDLDASK